MKDINWFCDYFGIEIALWQKVMLNLLCGSKISHVKHVVESMDRLENKYES